VLTAFAAQYGAGVPDTTDWKNCVTAFLFGFGIDQLRDRTTGTTMPVTTAPTVAPAKPNIAASNSATQSSAQR
jgi:hypothetical protein